MRVIFLGDELKTAVITGASGGIGSATVKALIKEGFFVFGQYNANEEGINNLINDLKKDGLSDYFYCAKADLSTVYGAQKFFNDVVKVFKHVDLLVNNAGVDLYKLAIDTTEKEWDYLFNVNVRAGFILSKLFLPNMVSRKSGKIIFVSSVWGLKGACMESAYSSSKWAVIGLAKSLAIEYAPSGITVNCVCPGVVDTPMNDVFTKEEKQNTINDIPVGRICTPSEVAQTITFVASDKANYMTGATITLDGGFTL